MMSFLRLPGYARLFSVGARLGTQNAAKIIVATGGKRMTVEWDGDGRGSPHQSTYHSVWLRRNCQCPQCLNPQNQSIMLSYDLDPTVTLSEAATSNGDVILRFRVM